MDSIEVSLREKIPHNEISTSKTDKDLLDAAVLVLFVKIDDIWKILFTRRTDNVKTHRGEVSFPGGAREPGDISLEETALRETEEEIGIPRSDIEIIGNIEKYQTITNFVVYPFVGILKNLDGIQVNNDEVEKVFLIPISWLIDPKNYYERDLVIGDKVIKRIIHYENFEGEHLWGFTARVAQQVLQLIK